MEQSDQSQAAKLSPMQPSPTMAREHPTGCCCYRLQAYSNGSVTTTEMRTEPPSPARLEKKKNMRVQREWGLAGSVRHAGALPRHQLGKQDRPKIMNVHADIVLPRHMLQATMAVAMKIDCTTMSSVPCPKGVVTQHQHDTFHGQLRIGPYAGPVERSNAFSIDVANDQMFSAIQPRQY